MTGYKLVNLRIMIDEIGESSVKPILSDFACPLNPEVEQFIRQKAVEFSKQGLSQTHLVMASYKNEPVITGYFTLANKFIHIPSKNLPSRWRRRISKFGQYNPAIKAYVLTAPLIAQLGKNFFNGYNNLITGDELLKLACDKIGAAQLNIGGKIAYVECEDKPGLIEFYESNDFWCFGKRSLDPDETPTHDGRYLLQYLCYIN